MTFAPNGTVSGEAAGKPLSGTYVVLNGNLTVAAGGQFMATSSLLIGARTASATLINGDSITCRRLR
jgi:hypothetical protein